MYCAEGREFGRMPWQHAKGCAEGVRQTVRWYEAGLPIVLAYAFVRLGYCS